MQEIDTMLTPREALNRLYDSLRKAYMKVMNAQPGDARADELIFQEIEVMESWLEKLDVSFLKKVRNDANIDSDSYEKLKKLESLLKEVEKSSRISVHKSHDIFKTARRIKRTVSGQARKTKRGAQTQIKKTELEKKKLDKKKQKVQVKQDKAKQVLGKKK